MTGLPVEPAPKARTVDDDLAARLGAYEEILRKWQPKMNLVAPSTMKSIRTRHIEDSLQVTDVWPRARRWIDLGSGGGFPGIVSALRLRGEPGAMVHLVESDHRKCAFLREVSRETQAPVEVHRGRIEEVLPTLPPAEAISARALASLPILVEMTLERLEEGAVAVFLKGQDVGSELTQTPIHSSLTFRLVASRTDAQGRIVMIGRSDLFAANGSAADGVGR
jgi:16S rRNA (guanine527-N7)-methyltransferase